MRINYNELSYLQKIERTAITHYNQNKMGGSLHALLIVEKLEKEIEKLGKKYGFNWEKAMITGKGYIKYRVD